MVTLETSLLSSERVAPSVSPLDTLRDRNEALWNAAFWCEHINDPRHYDIVIKSRGVFSKKDLPYISSSADPTFKLVYDSHLWLALLARFGLHRNAQSVILELLPGRTYALPVALESLAFF